ncbi:MAG: thioredoxin family protein [Cyanobacteria bacterium P01_A01_bin.135]
MAPLVDEDSFHRDVLGSRSPVLVHFSAPWCGLCRLLEPMLGQLKSDWDGQLKLVTVNADDSLKLANTYRLRSLPTLVLFDQGRVIHRIEDFYSNDDLQLALGHFNNIIERLTMSCII